MFEQKRIGRVSRKNREIYIYALTDPDGHIRYIGQSVDPLVRYDQHIGETADTPKGRWIRELKSRGAKPGLTILEKTDKSNANYVEKWWITLGHSRGWQLCNVGKPTRKNPSFGDLFSKQLRDDFDKFKIEHDPVVLITRGHIRQAATALHVLLGVVVGVILGWHTYLIEASVVPNPIAAIFYGFVPFLIIAHGNYLWATGKFKKDMQNNLTIYGVALAPVLVTVLIFLVFG